MKLLLLSGSFHSKSRSLAILNEIQGYFPEHDYVFPDLTELPFYSEDLNQNKPAEVVRFIDEVVAADAIIVCSPEYNHSVPAVVKNAIDWASRPAYESVLKDKPVSIITQANSAVGGARVQAHLKLIFDSTLSRVQPVHEMLISGVSKVIDSNAKIIDEKVETRLKRHLTAFFEFVTNQAS